MYPKSPPSKKMCVSEKSPLENNMCIRKVKSLYPKRPLSHFMPRKQTKVRASEKTSPCIRKDPSVCSPARTPQIPTKFATLPRYSLDTLNLDTYKTSKRHISSQWHTHTHTHTMTYIGKLRTLANCGHFFLTMAPHVHWHTGYIGTGCGTSPRITIEALKPSLVTCKVSVQASYSPLAL